MAVADDITAVYWNPAGLANQKDDTVYTALELDKFGPGDVYPSEYKSAYPYFFATGFNINDHYVALAYCKVGELYQNKGRGKSWLYGATGFNLSDRLS